MMRYRRLVLALLFACFVPPAHAGQTSSDSRYDRLATLIHQRFDELRGESGYPGGTVGFVLPDGHAGAVSVGVADRERGEPLSPDRKMLTGSTGKTFFSALALQLASEGKLSLETPISEWLGEETWFHRLPNAADITIRMLMNHTSGIPRYVLKPEFAAALRKEPQRVWKPEDLIAFVLDDEPAFAAGQGFSYADTNYLVLGIIMEKSIDQSAYEEIEERFLRPLKLESTVPSVSAEIPGLAPGYAADDDPLGLAGRMVVNGRLVVNPQFEWAGGGFATTPGDLARWAKSLYGGQVLDPAALRNLLDGVEAKAVGGRYGLGVQIRETDHGTSYGHSGFFPGYLTDMIYDVESGVALAIQFNSSDFQYFRQHGPGRHLSEFLSIIKEELRSRH